MRIVDNDMTLSKRMGLLSEDWTTKHIGLIALGCLELWCTMFVLFLASVTDYPRLTVKSLDTFGHSVCTQNITFSIASYQ